MTKHSNVVGGLVDKLVYEKLPIKATEIGWEAIGEDVEDFKQSLATELVRMMEEALGEDETEHPDWCGTYEPASEHTVCSCGLYSRNELRAETRTRLTAIIERELR